MIINFNPYYKFLIIFYFFYVNLMNIMKNEYKDQLMLDIIFIFQPIIFYFDYSIMIYIK